MLWIYTLQIAVSCFPQVSTLQCAHAETLWLGQWLVYLNQSGQVLYSGVQLCHVQFCTTVHCLVVYTVQQYTVHSVHCTVYTTERKTGVLNFVHLLYSFIMLKTFQHCQFVNISTSSWSRNNKISGGSWFGSRTDQYFLVFWGLIL